MINKIKIFLTKKQITYLTILFFGILFSAALEMIGIGTIPIFVNLLLDPNKLFSYFPQNSFLIFIAEKNYSSQVLYCAIILLTFFIFKNIFFFIVNFFQARIFRDMNIENSKRLFQAYLDSPYSFHLNRNPAIITRNVLGDVVNASSYVDSLMNVIREILIIAVIFTLLLLVDPITSLSVFIIMGFFTIIFYLVVKKKITNLSKTALNLRALQVQLINQVFGAIKDTKIFSREKYFIDEFKKGTFGVERANFFSQIVNKTPRIIMEILAIISILLVTLLFVMKERSMAEMIPTLSLLGVATIRLIPSFNTLSTTSAIMRKTAVSFNLTVNELSNLEKYNSVNSQYKINDKAINYFSNKNIEIKNISFQYPNSNKKVLKNISFNIESGSSIGIIGTTGSGKSTLTNIILGLLEPTNGQVIVGGKNINTDYRLWQNQIGFIPQDIYLIDDTIRRNIAFGISNSDIDEEKIQRSIKLSQLKDFISDLPLGLDTTIGNRGIRLSGGQLQRVGIARALYRKTRLLIFDEATSSLDIETERKLIKDIEGLRNDNTLIIVTHRLSTIRNCDRIFLFSEGNLIDQGKFDELVQRHQELKSDSLKPNNN